MELVTDEQKEKQTGLFIKLEDKAKLTIFSNLGKVKTHFLKSKNTSVIHKDENCAFDGGESQPRIEYFYYADVSGEQGVVRVPASVFFALNEQERVLEIDKRDNVWIISKTGSGLKTEYGVARGKEAGSPPIPLEEANKKLVTALENYSKSLERRYSELVNEPPIPDEEPQEAANDEEEE